MSAKKTALQQAIEFVEKGKELAVMLNNYEQQKAFDFALSSMRDYLPTERSQIEEAAECQTEKTGMTGSEYYESTYETP